MLELEVLVGELVSVDGLAAGAVESSEVTALEHELGDHTVEDRAGVAEAVLARRELVEVAGCLGHVSIVELERDAAQRGAVAGNVEEDLGHGDQVWFRGVG